MRVPFRRKKSVPRRLMEMPGKLAKGVKKGAQRAYGMERESGKRLHAVDRT